MGGLCVRGVNLMAKVIFPEVSSSLSYSNSPSIFFCSYSRSLNYGGFLMLYNLLQAISIVYLFIIQPCTQVPVLLSSFSGFLQVIVVENTV